VRRRFGRFLFIGVAAAAVNILSRVAISHFVRFEYAVALAFPIALTFAFLMSRLFVFEISERSVWEQYCRFFLVNMVALVQVWLVSVGLTYWVFPAIGWTVQAELAAHTGVKVLFIKKFGSAVPYWDQWDAEADIVLKTYLNSNLSLATLFSSHNEHRILMSRIFSLVLFELDGAWDPILQMIANAVLHVGAIVLLVLIIQRIIRPTQFILLALFSTFVFVLPIGWENLLAGFQSQFYLLLLFSLLALTGFAAAAAFSPAWWGSILCSIAAYFSMASGALTPATALAMIFVQYVGTSKANKRICRGWRSAFNRGGYDPVYSEGSVP
jgi:putative flippase GtrA